MPSFGSMTPQMGNANQVLGAPTELNQVGPGAPNFQPGLLPPPANVQGAPQMQGLPGAQPTPPQMPPPGQAPIMPPTPQPALPPQQGGVVGLPPAQSEAQMMVKALISRLANHTKAEEMQRGER